MILIVFILLIWLIVLQVTVNRLQDQIDRLGNTQSPTKQPTFTPGKTTPPPANPAPSVDNPEPAPFVMHEVIEDAPAQPVRVNTPKPAQPHTPPVEITAAKVFSWIGGFMLFLGVVFGIKYAVENSILTPAARVTLSLLTVTALAIAGYVIKNPKYRVTAHTLLGSGIAIIYAALFCAHTLYHFINLPVAFFWMAVTSFVALGASLKKEAKYVGYLGAIIAFLTPLLLNNGADAWVAFFLYVFCINAAAAYAAVKKQWNGLLVCTLSLTWLSQAAWLFPLANYKLLGVVIFFSLYALASAWLARRHYAPSVISYAVGGFLSLGLALMLPASAWLSSPVLSTVPNTIITSLELLGYVLLVNTLLLLLAGKQYIAPFFAKIAKIVSFLILYTWILNQAAHLPLVFTLGMCVVFAALNSGVELAFGNKPDKFSVFYPLATMVGLLTLALLPGHTGTFDFISVFGIMSLLLVGTLLLTVIAGMLWVGFAALGVLFVFLVAGLLIGMGGSACATLVLISGLMPLFLCAGAFYALRRAGQLQGLSLQEKGIGAVTALMPFVLILTVLAQSGARASLVGILTATWVVCALSALAARLYKATFTLPAAAVGAGVVQLALWGHFIAWQGWAPLGTFSIGVAALLALFIALPFISKDDLGSKPGTWIACALAGISACLVEYLALARYQHCFSLGMIPAALLGIYALLLRKLWGNTRVSQAHPVSLGFMCAAVLVFLTAIFPLEIHSHWLCVAWAAEAVFLACVHKKLPHPVWQVGAAGLLCVVACWLLLGGQFTPLPTLRIWNWYLWIYGLCAGALFVTAYLWQPDNWKRVFNILGGCMLFWLLNIEIAHWFHTGRFLSFDFTGQVAQALTYTLAWGLFAFCTMGLGLRLQKSTVSKIGVGVMSLALLKFFLSDIWQLQAIYRILGLFGLAVLLIVASFWYQKKQKVQ